MKRALLFVSLLAAGCVVHAQPLSTVSLSLPGRLDPAHRTARRFLVLPFEDVRGAEFARTAVNNHIPVVNLFYQHVDLDYPEHAGILTTDRGHDRVVAVGTLDTALPQLLGTAIERMALGPVVSAAQQAELPVQPFDYVVSGRIRETRFDHRSSVLLAVLGGFVGVPFEFISYHLAYDVMVYDVRDRLHPIFQRTYSFDDSRAAGLYYNGSWAYPMFVRGLEKTLPRVVADLADVVVPCGRG